MNDMNKTIRTLTCAILGLAATAKIQAETVTSVTPDESGNLTFNGDTTLRCEGLTVEGDITVNDGTLTLEGGVPTLSYDNFLAVYNDGTNHLYYPSTAGDGVKLLENVRLDDIDYFTGRFGGSWSGSDLTMVTIGRLFDRTSESALLQFTVLENYRIKWMNYELRQIGNDIYVKGYKWAKYADLASSAAAMRAMHQRQEVYPEDNSTGIPTAIAKNDGCYGVARVSAILKNGPAYTIKGNITATAVSLSNATLRVQASVGEAKTFATKVTGFGALKFTGASEKLTFPGFDLTTTAKTIATNAKVGDFIPLASKLSGGSVNNSPRAARVTNVKRTATTCTFQVVAHDADDGDWNKGSQVVLEQSGDDVTAKIGWARYANAIVWATGYDLDNKYAGSSVATSESTAGYCAYDVELLKGGSVLVGNADVENTFEGLTTVENCVVTMHPKAIGWGQAVRVKAGGDLRLAHTSGAWNYGGRTNTFFIERDGVLATSGVNDYIIGYNDRVVVNGGRLSLQHTNGAGGRDCYINHIELHDGALIEGSGVLRVGYWDNGTIALKDGEATIACNYIKTLANNPKTAIFDVAKDATLMIGAKMGHDTSYKGLPVIKRGEGKLLIMNETKDYTGPVTLEAGTLTCNWNGALVNNPLVFAGGTLAMEGYATQLTTGALTLSAKTTLGLTAGQKIIFANSSAQEWTEGAKLTIPAAVNLRQDVVRFGTSDTGLTAAQLKAIVWEGGSSGHVMLDANGYLRPLERFIITIR